MAPNMGYNFDFQGVDDFPAAIVKLLDLRDTIIANGNPDADVLAKIHEMHVAMAKVCVVKIWHDLTDECSCETCIEFKGIRDEYLR